MQWKVGTRIAAAFGLVLAILAVVGTISYRSTSQLIEATGELSRSYEITSLHDDVLAQVREMQLRLRNYLLTQDPSEERAFRDRMAGIELPLRKLQDRVAGDAAHVARLEKTRETLREYTEFANTTIEQRRAKGVEAAVALMVLPRNVALVDALRGPLDDIERIELDRLQQRSEQVQSQADLTRWVIVAGSFAGVVVAVLAGVLLARGISRPLGALTAAAEKITVGDLSAHIEVTQRGDEIGVLSAALARMAGSLRGMASTAESIALGDLRSRVQPQSPADVLGNAFARMSEDLRGQIRGLAEGAGILSASASEIVASTSQLVASASQSAAAVTQTTATVEEVRQTAQLASQKARNVSDSAQHAVQVSENGRKSTQDVEAGMLRMRRQMELIAASMVRLSEQSQAVGQIIATVEDIATQSNLLAVNAAIEAAKAGVHGAGFGVVAQEVKSLAEQSRQATGQVRGILGDIQKATASAVLATEEGSKAVEAGIAQGELAAGSIDTLATSVAESAQAAVQIVASSQQQLMGVDQVAGAMESIRQASAQNVASATQLETTARDLEQLGHRLKQMVERYQL
jgi:methyl-accepting chemotaxis protein